MRGYPVFTSRRLQSLAYTGAGFLFFLGLSAGCQDDVDTSQNQAPGPGVNNPRPEPNAAPGPDASPVDDVTVPPDVVEEPWVGQCTPGQVLGCVDETSQRVCQEDGQGVQAAPCAEGLYCLDGECGTQLCRTGTQACKDASTVHVCNAEGTGYTNEQPCPDEEICEFGACRTICDLGGKGPSYIGCEYWTVDLDQYPDPTSNPSADEIPHSVVISNPNNQIATLTFETRAVGVTFNIPDPTVPPGQARAFQMPRLDVDGTGITQNAIHIRSSMPVVAHQFNPLNNERVYSQDASLLLPTNALGKEYYVMNWPTQVLPCISAQFCPPSQHSYVTIVATTPGETAVLVNSRARIASGPGINEFPPNIGRNFLLQQGDVLNLEARSSLGSAENDLTGTYIAANNPIAVFAGHEQAVIGNNPDLDSCCADHLEQQLFPLESWGQYYVATFSPGRGEKVDHWRILAGEDNVTITTNPPQPGAHNVVLNKGDHVKFYSNQSFEVRGTGKISVGQFLVSQGQTSEVTGDPAFVLAVPVERFREDYHLLTPMGYTSDYVVIIRLAGQGVTLDGVAVPEASFAAVGSGQYEVSTQAVQAGVHVLEGEAPFGIIAYGFNRAVSYAYPGGLDLVGADPDSQ